MVGVADTFVPTYQGLAAMDLLRRAPAPAATCFPLNVAGRLPFYRARNAIYHLSCALVERHPQLTVLAPDYNSGNEILAMRAAGVGVHYYPVDRQMQIDQDLVHRLCDRHRPDVLYVIHYAGWPQPMPSLVDFCRTREILLVEDCALSLLSELDGQPLGSFGDWSVFCLYKTLPLPNGALLVQNGPRLDVLERLQLRGAGPASVIGRTAELLVQRLRGRVNGVGAVLQLVKRGAGRVAGALDVHRANVGDIGFNLDEVDLAMSPVSARLLDRLDIRDVRKRRIDNYRLLDTLLDSRVVRVFPRLPDGVCPLFFPILVPDKHETAGTLRQRGIDALEFWNESMDSGEEMSDPARFLRAHVLELPIHQDLTPRQIVHVARTMSEVAAGHRGSGSRDRNPGSGIRDPRRDIAVPRQATHSGVRVDRIRDLQGLTALRPHWNELLRESAADTPFLTWEWLHAWWTHLSGKAPLETIAVWRDDRLIALAPLMTTRAFGFFPRLEFLGTGYAGSDYLDVIARRGHEDAALDAVAQLVRTERRSLRLDHVLEESLAARLADRLRRSGWTLSTAPGGVCPVIDLASHTWDSYLASRGPAHRANVRRRGRALEQQFRPAFERVATDLQRHDALSALFSFHERRFRERGGSTAFLTPSLRAFHHEATKQMLERGLLRMYVLRIDDAAAAVMYGFGDNGQFYFYQHGFDDRYRHNSIGLVLMTLTLRAALEEGMHTFDLLWGEEPYKWLWATGTRTLQQIQLFPPHLEGRLHHAAVAARRRISVAGSAALQWSRRGTRPTDVPRIVRGAQASACADRTR